jgi:hypothetical protein
MECICSNTGRLIRDDPVPAIPRRPCTPRGRAKSLLVDRTRPAYHHTEPDSRLTRRKGPA